MKNAAYITGIAVVVSIALLTQTENSRNNNRQPNSRYYPESVETIGNTESVPETPATNAELLDIYYSQQNNGVIGKAEGEMIDDPHDNVFHIYIGSELQENKQAYLEYDLYGAGDFTSVSRSINDEVAMGGVFVKLTDEWSSQSEKIASAQLQAGDNIVRFSVPGNGDDFSYNVKNVRIRFGESVTNTRQIVLNQPLSHRFYENEGYISGFVSGPGSNTARIYADGKQVRSYKGTFEGIAYNHDKTEGPWITELKAVFPDGETLSRIVVFDECSQSDFSNKLNREVVYNETTTTPQMPVSLNVPGFSLEGSAGSVANSMQMSVTGLRQEDMPLPGTDMINVTAENAGFRCLPHGKNFEKQVELRIKYDTTRIPAGYGPKDIRMFYYNEAQGEWIAMPQDSIDMTNCEIISHTDHFTDFIDGILKTPESPQTQAFTPTSMKDMKFGDPMAGVNMMNPPSANSNGTANLSYPILLPAGRQGMQPQLAITYNSEGGNGFLGVGWGMNIPSIEVETRWGVPRYSSSQETEEYLVNGQQVVELDITTNDTTRLPLIHMESYRSRSTDSVVYSYRVEGAFDRIIRYGSAPDEYWWKVVDKQGTAYYYGKYSTDAGVNSNCVLTDASGHIAHWALAEVRDVYGNYVKYNYMVVTHLGSPGNNGKQIYPDSIIYTGFGTTDGKYTVSFVYDAGRTDYQISGRYGFLEVTDRLLGQINISYDNQFVRQYGIKYKTGAYNKNLICAIADITDSTQHNLTKREDCSTLDTLGLPGVKVHSFDYYEEEGVEFSTQENTVLTVTEVQENVMYGAYTDPSNQSLGKSTGFSGGGGGSLSFGIGSSPSKKNTLGGNLSFSFGAMKDKVSMMDMNGDGITDKVYRDGNDIYYYKGELNGQNQLQFSSTATLIPGLLSLNKNKTRTTSFGGELTLNLVAVKGSASYTHSKTKQKSVAYFADLNADGYVDYIHKNGVYFNQPDTNDNPVFVGEDCNTTTQYFAEDPCYYIIHDGEIDSAFYESDEEDDMDYRRDPVRVWIAPGPTKVWLRNNIKRLNTSSAGNYSAIKYEIQKNDTVIFCDSIAPNDTTLHYNEMCPITVLKGDRLYFRLHSSSKIGLDDVYWNPIITSYTGACGLYRSYRDADDKQIDVFQYVDDNVLTEKRPYYAPLTGVIKISGSISSSNQSDSLNFRITHNQSNIIDTSFVDNQSFSMTFCDTINVSEEDSVLIKLLSNTNVNWSDIQYNCIIQYLSADSLTIDTTNLYYTIKSYPPLDMSIFPNRINKSMPILMDTGQHYYYPVLQFAANPNLDGSVVFTAKSKRKLLDEKVLTIQNGSITGIPDSNRVEFYLTGSDSIYFDYYTVNTNLGESLTNARTEYIDSVNSINFPCGFHTLYPDSMRKFGNLYRGWGQFSYYDSSNLSVCLNPIDESQLSLNALSFDTTALAQFPFSSMDTSMTMEDVDSIFDSYGIPDIYSFAFAPMTADCKNSRWVDFCPSAYVSDSVTGSTAGFGSIYSSLVDTSLFESDDFPMDDFDDPVPVSGNCGTTRVIMKRSISKDNSVSWSIGTNFASMSTSMNFNTTEGKNDYMDMNGDRYPDLIDNRLIQYTTAQGGLSTNVLFTPEDYISHGNGFGTGASLGVKGIKMKGTSSGKSSKGKANNIEGTFGIGNYNGNSEMDYIYADVNGDGLPDMVDKKTGFVNLNIGYGFTPGEQWSSVAISGSASSSVSANAGLDMFHKGNYSWSGGIGGSKNESYDNTMLADINNDGLADVMYSTGTTLMTQINTGHGFYPMTVNSGYSEHLSHARSYNVGGNVSGCIPILLPFFKFIITPYMDLSYNLSAEQQRLSDMNGDGFVDYVWIDNGAVKVKYGIPKKVNLLKEVTTPAQSTYTVDYQRTYPSRECMESKWVFASLKVYDGFVGDGEDTMYYQYSYSDPKYHRMERDFFGYETVTTGQYNSSSVCYRTTVDKYHNDDFLFKGLKYYEAVEGGTTTLYVETYYTWDPKEISTGRIIPRDSMSCFGPYYPAISQEDKYFYEGQTSYQIHTRKTYRHGQYGNVKQYINYGDTAYSTDDVRAEILYTYDLANYFLAMVSQLDVYDYQSNLLRRKTGLYNTQGRISSIVAYDGSNYAYTDIEYNSVGGIEHIQYPKDVNNDRIEYTYTYDPDVYTYPASVTDFWGNTSSALYDLKLGLPTEMIDISGNVMEFSYYNDGKPKTVTGPNELAANIPWTIKYEYWDETTTPGSNDLWALTRHYDTLNAGNEFVTVNFSDGLGRSIQAKKKSTISGTDSMVVSGNVEYDAYGRSVSVSLPTTEALGTETTFTVFSPSNFATTIYDILDRPTQQIAPDNTTVSYGYDFGPDYFGKTCFKTKVTDPNGIITTKYNDARGLNTSVTAPMSTITSFEYDGLGELLTSTDPEGNPTYYNYDMFGHLTSRNHPDAGTTSYTYDLAGNVQTVQTENLAGNSQYIVYNYADCRLEHIEYPQNPEMNVYYEYGAPNSGNESGRLVKQQDASGVQTFEYGNMGELTKNIHTFVVPSGNAYTLETDWEYDSWNRMKSITYPDGEVVSYHYDNGGQLIALDGVKLYQTFDYITDVQYNLYGSREQIDYGNGTYTEYTYDLLNQRLTHLTSYENSGLVMQSIDYNYDNASNITKIENYSDVVGNGTLGGNYTYKYYYDELYRLTSSGGDFNSANFGNLSFDYGIDYSLSGNITRKFVNASTEIGGGLQSISYDNNYQYNGRPHTVSQTDAYTYDWDANGNMKYREDNNTGFWRKLCWDEENRLTTVRNYAEEPNNLSSYLYDAGGERVWKLTGNVVSMYINGQGYVDGVEFGKTMYVNPYMVVTEEGYTKHYYIEGERVCSKIGGSGWVGPTSPNSPSLDFIVNDASSTAIDLWKMVLKGIECSDFNPEHVFITPAFQTFHIRYTFPETDLYFYHPDHLGSSSFISDAIGYASQHLQYLPFGETFVDQQNGYDSRYTFSAKEKDDETQYSYFGARYYDSDLSIWLCVDPMANKYPELSPYMYVAGNPIKMIDPDGKAIHIINPEALDAFNAMLKSFSGVNDNNKYRAFGITSNTNNVYVAAGMKKKEFAKNFESETGVKLKGQQLNEAYNIHRALASDETVEVAVFRGTASSNTTAPGQQGTTIVNNMNGYKRGRNFNPEVSKFYDAADKQVTPEQMKAIFELAKGDLQGNNWKLFSFKSDGASTGASNSQTNHQGTVIISGDNATTTASRSGALKEALQKIQFKCTTCD